MSCLGGTQAEPRIWYRYRGDDAERMEGRICTGARLASPRTSRRKCSECPAFRGLRWDGRVATGVAVDGTVYALSPAEHEAYQQALEAQLIEDEDGPLFAFFARMDRELVTLPDGRHQVLPGIGERGLLRIGDPDATERHAERMRRWREAHPGHDKRKRDRAAYMRAYRARGKAGA